MLPILLFLLLWDNSNQISFSESKTYWAGVVEFSPEPLHLPDEIRVANSIKAYVDIIHSPEATLTDIIVFPEGTLSFSDPILLPELNSEFSPCVLNNSHPVLRNISCAALNTQKYIVINLEERVDIESKLGRGKSYKFNTNVVFDRKGRIISRYRKTHLFFEPQTNTLKIPDVSSFTTDFNVTFGHFICFDILHKTPAINLRNNKTIHDFVFPTMWMSELPFMTSLQVQDMWSKHQMNLLAAGANLPAQGSTGSGIYSRNGPLKSIFSGVPIRKILVAEVPKKEFWDDPEISHSFFPQSHEQSHVENVKVLRENLESYSWKMLKISEGESEIKEKLCNSMLCCDFLLKVNKTKVPAKAFSYRNAIAVFDGIRSYGEGNGNGGVFTCALISCLSDSLSSCGLLKTSTDNLTMIPSVLFKEVRISGLFRSGGDQLTMATTLDLQMQPLMSTTYDFVEGKEVLVRGKKYQRITMKLTVPDSNIYTFGIYGRDFSKDNSKNNSPELLLAKQIVIFLCVPLILNLL